MKRDLASYARLFPFQSSRPLAGRRKKSVRAALFRLMAMSLLPMFLVAAAFLWKQWDLQRRAAIERLQERAQVLALAAGGTWLANRLAARLSRPLADLAKASVPMRRGEAVATPATSIREIDALGQALRRAAESEAARREELGRRLVREEEAKATAERLAESLRETSASLELALASAQLGSFDYHYLTGEVFLDEKSRSQWHLPSDRRVAGETALRLLHPDDRARVQAAARAAAEPGSNGEFKAEYRIVWPDGSVHWIAALGKVHFEGEGESRRPVRMTGVHQDISERKRAENALRESERLLEQRVRERTAELEAANKELEAFSYSVSHDLRSPLRAINGFSRILLQEHAAALGPDLRRYLDLIHGNTMKVGRLIDDLLAFSQLGRQPLKKQPVSLDAMVGRCIEELRPEWEGREVRFDIGELGMCHADPALLKQVVVNLLSNALKYSRRREVARVEMGATAAADEKVIFIRDNGVGFDPRYADRLFGVFQRLHRSEDFEGTGVGLAIVERILHRHGGRIWAESQVDQGASFYFALPVASSS